MIIIKGRKHGKKDKYNRSSQIEVENNIIETSHRNNFILIFRLLSFNLKTKTIQKRKISSLI